MDLDTITVQDFKDEFFRGFDYLPTWDVAEQYFAGDIAYYAVNGQFYKCLTDNTVGGDPSTSSDWERTTEVTLDDFVRDQDITKAFAEAQQVFNQGLGGTDAEITLAYLYLTAHFLVVDLRAAVSGFGVTAGVLTSRSVGSVSESYQTPDAWTQDPVLYPYTTTAYGIKYLNLWLAQARGNVQCVAGAIRP